MEWSNGMVEWNGRVEGEGLSEASGGSEHGGAGTRVRSVHYTAYAAKWPHIISAHPARTPRVPARPRASPSTYRVSRAPPPRARAPRPPSHRTAHRTSHIAPSHRHRHHIALADAKMPFSFGRELLDIPDILYLVTKKLENDQLNFLSTCKVLAPRRTHFLVLKLIHENNKNLMELVNLERAFSEKREETFYPISQEVFNRCCFDQQIILAEIESIINTYIYLI